MLKIRHKAIECIGCAQCVEIAPDYWELDEDGMARLLNRTGVWREFSLGQGPEVDRRDLVRTGESCPVSIIEVR